MFTTYRKSIRQKQYNLYQDKTSLCKRTQRFREVLVSHKIVKGAAIDIVRQLEEKSEQNFN